MSEQENLTPDQLIRALEEKKAKAERNKAEAFEKSQIQREWVQIHAAAINAFDDALALARKLKNGS